MRYARLRVFLNTVYNYELRELLAFYKKSAFTYENHIWVDERQEAHVTLFFYHNNLIQLKGKLLGIILANLSFSIRTKRRE